MVIIIWVIGRVIRKVIRVIRGLLGGLLSESYYQRVIISRVIIIRGGVLISGRGINIYIPSTTSISRKPD